VGARRCVEGAGAEEDGEGAAGPSWVRYQGDGGGGVGGVGEVEGFFHVDAGLGAGEVEGFYQVDADLGEGEVLRQPDQRVLARDVSRESQSKSG
jgi:hypothetical protein